MEGKIEKVTGGRRMEKRGERRQRKGIQGKETQRN